ncbi:MAG: twin-arginine translocation signal domain-containing protein [Planctomycetales bacterium]|nr:twin-arginine translocation signal domain-containing protein [Planctomycetales bacterium]
MKPATEQPASHRQTNRRQFLETSLAAGAALAAAPAFVHASDKAGTKNVIVGQGDYQYECLHDWGMDALPSGAHYGNASHGVAIDSQGLIYITHYGKPDSVFVFDADGKFVRSFGALHAPGGAGKGHGIDIRQEGSDEFIYLSASESNLSFAKLDMKGELVWEKGLAQLREETGQYTGDKPRYRPTNISFSPDGGYFLGDGYGSDLIHQYDKDGKYLRTIGGTGSADGQFRTPHGQWLDDRDGAPKLIVADRANKRLQWFDMQGKHLKTLDGFLFPADIDQQGDLLVVPDLHCRITLLDKENNVVAQLGDDEEWRKVALAGFKMRGQRDKWQPGKFVHPHDACFDSDGNIFVAEWVATGRVTKLRKV